MQGFIKVPKEFENILLLSVPCTEKEVTEMIAMLQKIKHTEDIVSVIRRLAFERDMLRDKLSQGNDTKGMQ